MNIIDNLNILDGNINSVKQNLITNLSEKGITVTEGDTLSVMINKVNDIAQGGGIDWSDTGYTEEPKPIADEHSEAAKWYNEWNPANTKLDASYTLKYPSITVFPKIDTSNVTDMGGAFFKNEDPYQDFNSIEYVPSLNTSNVTEMWGMFNGCTKLKEIGNLDTSNAIKMNSMFSKCTSLTKTSIIDISSCTTISYIFQQCENLTEVYFKGQPQSGLNITGMFYGVTTTGTFYYDVNYDYSAIIAVLPSTWKAVPYDYTDYDADLDWQALGVEEGVNPEQLIFDNTLAFKERYVPEYKFRLSSASNNARINTPILPSLGDSNTNFRCSLMIGKDENTYNVDGGIFETGMIPLNGNPKDDNLGYMFENNNYIRIARVNIHYVRGIDKMFYNCTNLKELWFKGNPSDIQWQYTNNGKAFYGTPKVITLYYDYKYDYSKIGKSSWVKIPWNYETNQPA